MEYGLLGKKLGHSYSKEIHESIADYKYELRELTEDELGLFLREKDFKAVNVTIPYKESVIPYLDEISEKAKEIGAVNTIVDRGGKLFGDNTDFDGMRALIRHAGIPLDNKKVLIAGTGGTSKTASAVASSLGAKEVLKISRSPKDGAAVSYEDAYEKHSDADIIINTTPCGMYPDIDAVPVDVSRFDCLSGVIDAVYNPLRSQLVLDAQKRGIRAEGGLFMLAAQAVYACENFLGELPGDADELSRKAFERVRLSKENIVLCGMPSCGKSTVGTELAARLKRRFVDMDDVIVSRIGMSIADFFEKKGEAAFRDIESDVAEDLSKETGLVIATGGGAILREANVDALKKNGKLFFIDRSPEKLIVTDDRPLSSDIDKLKKRYSERYDIYCSVADVHIDGNGSIDDVVKEIQGKR